MVTSNLSPSSSAPSGFLYPNFKRSYQRKISCMAATSRTSN